MTHPPIPYKPEYNPGLDRWRHTCRECGWQSAWRFSVAAALRDVRSHQRLDHLLASSEDNR